MKIIIHRGTHEIGGSCVELSTANTRIILDVGMPLVDENRKPFDQSTVRGKTVERLLAEGTLPNVPGLFDVGPPVDAILLSHAHLDHTGLLHHSQVGIPVYATKGTSKMMLAGAIFSQQRRLDPLRYREVIPDNSFNIGDFRITPYAVDHSIFGSVAFLIESGTKKVVYSGDIRLHGRKPGMGRKFIEELDKLKIDVLLMEGTHFGQDDEDQDTEQALEEEIVRLIDDAEQLVLGSFSPMDLDRLVTYYRAAQRTRRVFVVDVYAGFVLHLVAGDVKVPRPVTEAGIRVYYNQAFEKAYRRRSLDHIHGLFLHDRISMDEIIDNPSNHLMVFRPSMTELDFNGNLPTGCRCLYSRWEGYLANSDWIELKKHLAAVQGDLIPVHTSGHIFVRDLIKLVRAIKSNVVIPIHTFEPQEFSKQFSNVVILEDGQPYDVP